jgi:hypothetical protein
VVIGHAPLIGDSFKKHSNLATSPATLFHSTQIGTCGGNSKHS